VIGQWASGRKRRVGEQDRREDEDTCGGIVVPAKAPFFDQLVRPVQLNDGVGDDVCFLQRKKTG